MTMQPQEISGAEFAFPANVKHLMPAKDAIPREFDMWGTSPWTRFVSEWFYKGAEPKVLNPKPGIDKAKALRHLSAIMRSFEPKHEHKLSAVAYLLSEWFEPLGSEMPGEPKGGG